MSESFTEFYGKRTLEGGIQWTKAHHMGFVRLIYQHWCEYGGSVCEIGVGSGAVLAVLLELGVPHVVGIDNDQRILDAAYAGFERLGRSSQVRWILGDAVGKCPVPGKSQGVVYSDGLLEHFSDEEITRILAFAEKLSHGVVLFGVPGIEWSHSAMGDERKLAATEWGRISGYPIISNDEHFVIGRRRVV